ncbi:hypothetical protein ACP70R_023561 [Stipagrostis hirtigluma subsp. patula]
MAWPRSRRPPATARSAPTCRRAAGAATPPPAAAHSQPCLHPRVAPPPPLRSALQINGELESKSRSHEVDLWHQKVWNCCAQG